MARRFEASMIVGGVASIAANIGFSNQSLFYKRREHEVSEQISEHDVWRASRSRELPEDRVGMRGWDEGSIKLEQDAYAELLRDRDGYHDWAGYMETAAVVAAVLAATCFVVAAGSLLIRRSPRPARA